MKKITVIHFVHTLYGGVANVVANLIAHQKKKGWKIVIAYVVYDKSFQKLVGEDVEYIKVEIRNYPGYFMCFGMKVKEIYDFYIKNHIGEKVICHIHNIQALGAFGNWTKIPLICTLHSLNGIDKSFRKRVSNKLYIIALKRLLKYDKQVTSVSKAIVKEYAKISNSQKIEIIYNGTKINPFLRKKQDKFTIGHVGNLSYAKGFDNVLYGFCNLPKEIRDNMQLFIAGNEDDFSLESIKTIAKKYGIINQIHYFGYVINAKKDFISMLDILILASRNEGLGLVQAEAMGYGIPVLGRDTGGICEILKDNYNGFVITSADDITERIQKLYEEKKLYLTFSKNALETYKEKFTQEIMCKLYDKKYQEIK